MSGEIEVPSAPVAPGVPTLSWEQRSYLEKQAELLNARTKYLAELKGIDPKLLREERKVSEGAITHSFPFWLTLWATMVMGWIFLLMVWRKDVFPIH